MSLIIDYSSSESETDGTTDDTTEKPISNQISESIANPFDSNNYDQSSTSSEEPSNETQLNTDLKSDSDSVSAQSFANESTTQSINSKVSIFSNPFKEEETKQMDQLERHVKMSEFNKQNNIRSDDSNKKSICWNYHKHKKCKFGNRCRFLHNDSNFIPTKPIKNSSDNKKKRTGITDSLIPPSKALKSYYSQRSD
jgi:hypothetical protein